MTVEQALMRPGVKLADGAWSTILRAQFAEPPAAAESLNLTHPEVVADLARRYLAAGAEFICTNTFAANRFAWRGGAEQSLEVARAGARLARGIVPAGQALLCGSIGPTGRILSAGEITPSAAAEAFAECALALLEEGVDAILLETFSELQEILVAIQAVREKTSLPVIASMSFDSGPQRTRTVMGDEAGACARALQEAGAAAIGCNCGAGAAMSLPAVVALRAATSKPLWVKPSAGLPEIERERTVYRTSPDEFAKACEELAEAGADVIGGCCGVGPEHIERLARALKRRKSSVARK